MTVEELIAELQKYPKHLNVLYPDNLLWDYDDDERNITNLVEVEGVIRQEYIDNQYDCSSNCYEEILIY
jgi:hypothetical protein